MFARSCKHHISYSERRCKFLLYHKAAICNDGCCNLAYWSTKSACSKHSARTSENGGTSNSKCFCVVKITLIYKQTNHYALCLLDFRAFGLHLEPFSACGLDFRLFLRSTDLALQISVSMYSPHTSAHQCSSSSCRYGPARTNSRPARPGLASRLVAGRRDAPQQAAANRVKTFKK